MEFTFSSHALVQMKLRGISLETVKDILESPQQIIKQNGKKIYQSVIDDGKYLIRIFVNHHKNPNLVITVYKTSKVNKYYES